MLITHASDLIHFKVYVEGFLHICIVKSSILGVNSYIDNDSKFCIDVVLKGGVMKLEYDSRKKWEEVLKALDGEFLNKVKPARMGT